MNSERLHNFRLSLILAGACAVVAIVAVTILYQVHLRETRDWLTVVVRSEAELIAAIARYDRSTTDALRDEDQTFDPSEATLAQIADAHLGFHGFGATGELTMGRAADDSTILIWLHRTNGIAVSVLSFHVGATPVCPMQCALRGESGTMTGIDYRSKTVVAAYEPVPSLGMGLVAKVDLAEIRAPFLRAGLIAIATAVFVVIVGVFLIRTSIASIVRGLRDRKQLLNSLISTIPYSVFWKDRNCRYLGCNLRFAREAGLQHPDEIVGKTDFELSWRENAELYQADDRAVMESGVSKLRYVEPQVRLDGSSFWLETSKALLRGPGGQVVGMVGIYADITDRKLVEKAKQERESMFRAITESARDAIIGIDGDGRISVFNAAAEQMYGMSADEMSGGSLDAIMPEESRAQHAKTLSAFLETGESKGIVGTTTELQGRRKGGEVFPIEIALSACDDVPSMRIVAIIRDITDRKRSERFQQVLSRISAASNLHTTKEDLLQYCHRQIAEVMNAENFYVAIYHPSTREYSFPYVVDHFVSREGIPLSRMDRSLTDYVRRTGRPFLADKTVFQNLIDAQEVEVVGTPAAVWMGLPLETPDGIIGVMALQSYENEREYGARELDLARGIAERIAPAITRMQAEAALGESEAKYRLLVENQTDLVVRLGLGGSFLYVNPSYCELFGKTENELLGNAFLLHINPEDRAIAAKALTDILRPPHSCSIELRAKTKYGWRWISWSGKAVLDEQGEATAIVGVGRDITERREAEETHRRLATAVEQASDAIVITNRDGLIEYVNPAFEQSTGYTRDEAVGQNSRILNSGTQDAEFYATLWQSISAGLVWKGRFVNRRKDGSLFQEVAIISPVRNEQGDIINYVAVKRDITQEIEMERQLNQAQKLEAVGSLAAGIAHEINTPIQFVGDNVRFLSDSFTDLLQLAGSATAIAEALSQGAQTDETLDALRAALERADVSYLRDEIPKAVEQTLDGVDRVATIVRAMKDFSHPEQKDKSSIDLNRAIQSTLIVARNELKYVADVVTDFDADLPPVLCHPSELNQVFLNILVNAAHAIADKGRDGDHGKGAITVSTRHDGENVIIAISDTGTGVPEEIRDHIFEHFFTTKKVGQGTGQGLSIARSVVVEKHGGEITFETEVGQGTTFYIRLPIGADVLETVT